LELKLKMPRDGRLQPRSPKPFRETHHSEVFRAGDTPVSLVAAKTLEFVGPDLRTDDTAKSLIRFWSISFVFERTYRLIFGTQLQLLQQANAFPVSNEAAQALHEKSAAAGNKQTFDQWVNYMISNSLLIRNNDGSFRSTPLNKQFLLFITIEGYPTNKPL
jgi:hypothetical protein